MENKLIETIKYKRLKALDKFVRKIDSELKLFKSVFDTFHGVTQIILTTPIWGTALYFIIRYGVIG